ncbi:MAG: tRNA lysidine(34) synthetase TilS [Acutalibacteraceae bacterium]|nr:tRNA lysidine(34) synthetase TilS [Acutalibacteraceae bacterium]
MIREVKNAVARYNMPLSGRTVAVGVSGGADSMALLHVLLELKDEFGMNIIACHVNHGIRGETADRDEKFVVEACKKLGVEVRVLRVDVPGTAKKMHLGVEECGRRIRYDFFNSVADDVIIATAHTLRDRSETLLLNITRGASVKGLCSIPAVRGNIVRPFIDCTRADIEKYCSDNSIAFVTDETNFEDIYSRNRIRLNVIPELKKLNPSLEKAFLRLISNAEEENDFMDGFSREILGKVRLAEGYDAGLLNKQHRAVRKRVIFEIINTETGIIPEAVHIEQVDGILSGGRTEIIGSTVVEVKNGILKINPETENYPDWECDFDRLIAEAPFGKIKGEIIHRNYLPPKQSVHNKVLDYGSIVGHCVLRNRRPGDKMKLAGSSCTKTLKKLFSEKHIENRNSAAVLADEAGICWVQGLGCADRCKIKAETDKILIIGEDKQND